MSETKTEPTTTSGTKTDRPRHYVEYNRDGTPQDVTLCGERWDRLNVQHNGSICQECVDEQKRRPKW